MMTLFQVGLSNAVVAAVMAVGALLITRRSRWPAFAHALWIIVLVKLVTPPLLLFPVSMPTTVRKNPSSPRQHSAPVATPDAPPVPTELRVDQTLLSPVATPDAMLRPLSETASTDSESLNATGSDPATPFAIWPANVREWLIAQWVNVLMSVWLFGSIVCLANAVRRLTRHRRWLRNGTAAPQRVERILQHVAEQIGLRRSPEVCVVPDVVTPMISALGGRGKLILPHGLLNELDDRQLATLLAHELAHLRRGDQWVRMLELIAGVLFWWHPVVPLAKRRILQAEEELCDAWVIWARPDDAETYASAILKTVDFLADATPLSVPMTTGIGDVPMLLQRMRRISHGTTRRTATWRGKSVLLLLAALLLPPGLVMVAVSDDEPAFAADFRAPADVITADGDREDRAGELAQTDEDDRRQLQAVAERGGADEAAASQSHEIRRELIDTIETLGGSAQIDSSTPEGRITVVSLNDTAADDELLERLSGETGLFWLELRGTKITDAGLAHLGKLTRLRALDLQSTNVTDAGIPHLMPLRRLQDFRPQGTGITMAGLRELWRVNPQIQVSDAERLPPGDPEQARRLLRAAGDAAIQKREDAARRHAETEGPDIYAAFRKRSERVTSFRFAWKQTEVHDRGTPDDDDDVVCPQESSLVVDGRRVAYGYSGLRLLYGSPFDEKPPQEPTNMIYQSRFDGTTHRSVFEYPESDRPKSGHSQPVGRSWVMNTRNILPLIWTYCPFDPAMGNLDWTEMEVLEDRQLVNGRSCMVFRTDPEKDALNDFVQTWWVDPAREYSIVRYEGGHVGQPPLVEFELTHALREDHGWVPFRWTIRSASGRDGTTTTTGQVMSFEINPQLSDEEFELELPVE